MIFAQLTQQLLSLKELLSKLNDDEYSLRISHLANASIGGHTRHIIELLQCALNGYEIGEVDYINRKRNLELETNRFFAQYELGTILSNVRLPDKPLKLTIDEIEGCAIQEVNTTYFREIVYNVEHVIHHLALIRVALIDMKLDIVDSNFGMAYSTIKYQKSMASY